LRDAGRFAAFPYAAHGSRHDTLKHPE